MIYKTSSGYFYLIKNYRDAFDFDAFMQRYVPSIYDKYAFIVGDVSSMVLRLTGFSRENNYSIHSYNRIPDYLDAYCNVESAYYILKRISEEQAYEIAESFGKVIIDRTDFVLEIKEYIKKNEDVCE